MRDLSSKRVGGFPRMEGQLAEGTVSSFMYVPLLLMNTTGSSD